MQSRERTGYLTPPVSSHDHVLGSLDAMVQLVEYGDFQCPYCGEANGSVMRVVEEMGSRLCYVFREFPLVNSHQYALQAAEAAEAAGAQGEFWPMHDMLYAHQNALDTASLEQYAAAIGLDVERFVRDVSEHRFFERIEEDVRSGQESGVEGTPTFFINGQLYGGSWEYDDLLSALQQASHVVR